MSNNPFGFGGPLPMASQFHESSNLNLMRPDDKEYRLMLHYNSKSASVYFDLMAIALTDNTWEFIDLESYQSSVDNVIHLLSIVKRYRKLQAQMSKLYYNESGFHIDDHNFETLDEVERAVRNKAFL